jgi:hypothetical protein
MDGLRIARMNPLVLPGQKHLILPQICSICPPERRRPG